MEQRLGKLGCGTPYEILLGMLCHSNANVERVADFFLSLYDDQSEAVSRYIIGFIDRLYHECDTNSPELKPISAKRMTAIDFPRPSPTLLLVWDFASQLARNPRLRAAVMEANGAEWFFSQARTLPKASENDGGET